MTIVGRVTRLFKADMHGILDRLEEPETVLRQAIRDMEEELAADEQKLKAEILGLAQLKKKQERLEARFGDYESHLETCLASGKDELAKSVIRKKLEDEKLLAALRGRIGEAENHVQTSERTLAERKEQLAAIRQKAELLVEHRPADPSGEQWRLDVSDAEVEIALMQERERRGGKTKRGGGVS